MSPSGTQVKVKVLSCLEQDVGRGSRHGRSARGSLLLNQTTRSRARSAIDPGSRSFEPVVESWAFLWFRSLPRTGTFMHHHRCAGVLPSLAWNVRSAPSCFVGTLSQSLQEHHNCRTVAVGLRLGCIDEDVQARSAHAVLLVTGPVTSTRRRSCRV